MQKRLYGVISWLFTVTLLSACSENVSERSIYSNSSNPSQGEQSSIARRLISPTDGAEQQVFDDGDVMLRLVQSDKYLNHYNYLRQSNNLGNLVTWLNQYFALPNNLEIVLTELGEENASHFPFHSKIEIGYELFDRLLVIFSNESNPEHMAELALIYIVMHEVGHDLLSKFQVPFTGNEETTVDEFASIFIAESPSAQDILAAASTMFLKMKNTTLYWEQHPPDEQRAFAVRCLVYGSRPRANWNPAIIPPESEQRCTREFERKVENWRELLGKYILKSASIPPAVTLNRGVSIIPVAKPQASSPVTLTPSSQSNALPPSTVSTTARPQQTP